MTRSTASRLPLARRTCRGLSLVEVVLFIVVVGAALSAVLAPLIQATASSADPQLQRQALAIAESMLEEVQLMPLTFCDGDDANIASAASTAGCASGADALGPDAGEARVAGAPLDHVNDYHGFTMTGIVDPEGSAVPGLASFNASVTVAPAALGSLGAGSGDALRITVTVTGPAGTSVTLDGYRTRHAPNASL